MDWGADQDKAVKAIKKVFASLDVLTHINPKYPIMLLTDASHFAIGAVLPHVVDDAGTKSAF